MLSRRGKAVPLGGVSRRVAISNVSSRWAGERARRGGLDRRALALGVKRLLDVAGSATALVLLSPVLVLLALLVWLRVGRPIVFVQERPGRRGRIFRIYKFRTMRSAVDELGRPLPDDKRLTPFGRLLRKTSLDELPELLNVLKGDMSLVGPRPLLVQYLPLYSEEQFRRHALRPGLTGWAQVKGRNALSWDEKFAYDLWYVDHWGLWLDLRILVRTLWMVLTLQGVNQPGHATTEYFTGNPHGH